MYFLAGKVSFMNTLEQTNTYIDEEQLITERMNMSTQNFCHKPLTTEKSLYSLVATGNIDALTQRKPSLLKKGLGKLSSDPVHNILFHFIINTSNCARSCIEEGMDTETAYTLSDLYIRKAEHASTIEEIEQINRNIMFDYATRMHNFSTCKDGFPEYIQRAIDYIDANLHNAIQAKDIADYINISVSSFSHRFTECTGMSFRNYLIDKRIYLAKQYLRHTDFSVKEIASKLSFCSSSHFTTCFKTVTGLSPQKYRADGQQKPTE